MKPILIIPAILSYLLFCIAMLPLVMASVAWGKAADRLPSLQPAVRKARQPRAQAPAFR